MSGRLSAGLNRRSMIRILVTGAGLLPFLLSAALAKPAKKDATRLKPGQFEWRPDRAPAGPVAIIVSIPKQQVYVYRNGIQIGVSSCSTGKKGHETPTGVFTILQKAKQHYSSTYDNAPMPNMERLTWDGIALHAGKLPGYPASHGCVRLPPAFAEKLYEVTQIGTPVIIAGDHTQPASVFDPGLILGSKAKEELAKVAKKTKTKPKFAQTDAVTSILVSSADKSIYVLQNGEIVAQGTATIANPSKPLGSHVFVLQGGDEKGFTWQASGFDTGRRAAKPNTSVVERVTPPQNVLDAINARMKPGMVFVTTDLPATADTRTGTDFVVMDAPAK
jgi:L,D-transpeptidase catalytic domain